jgi:hypothetical protein
MGAVAKAMVFFLMPDEIRSWCALRTSNYVREIYYVPIGWRCQSNVTSAVAGYQVVDFKRNNCVPIEISGVAATLFTTRVPIFFHVDTAMIVSTSG